MQQVITTPCTYILEFSESEARNQLSRQQHKLGTANKASMSQKQLSEWHRTRLSLIKPPPYPCSGKLSCMLPPTDGLVDPTGPFSCPNPGDPCLESLLPVPKRSHQAFGSISCHMSAPPRLATAPSETTQVSPLLAFSSAATLSW